MNQATYNLKLENTSVGAIGDHNQVTQNFIVQSPDYQALMGRIKDKKRLLRSDIDPLEQLQDLRRAQSYGVLDKSKNTTYSVLSFLKRSLA